MIEKITENKPDIITVKNLSKRYGRKVVFDNLSFSLPRNKIIGLLGENGIGKTTLLRLMADLLKPDGGEILIDGGKVAHKTARDKVSFLLDPAYLYSFMTVKSAIQYYKDFYEDFDCGKAMRLCEDFGLAQNIKQSVKKLSKGNKERLYLLLNLSRKVPVYLLDEPIAGLDPKFKRDLIKAFLSNIGENATLIISSHLLRDLDPIFDYIAIMKKNEIITANSEDIRAQGKSIEDFYLEVIG